MLYQYYDPHPHVCHMKQYEVCKNFHKTCPLYHICKDMNKEAITSVCKKDCATCNYEGCTMSKEKRISEPLYVNGLTRSEPIPLPMEEERNKERRFHLKEHAKMYHQYNMLFNKEYRQKLKIQQQNYRNEHRKQRNEWARKNYRKSHPNSEAHKKELNPEFLPPCKYDCLNCTKPDCDISENYYKNAYINHWRKNNQERYSEYRKKYYADNIEKERERLKKWREENPEKLKAQRDNYNIVRRQNYAKNKEAINAQRREHYAANKEKLAEQKRLWTAANKEKINQQRRERYATRKKQNLIPTVPTMLP